MTPATMELAPPAGHSVAEAPRHGHGRPSGLSLEDLVLGAWEDLAAHGRAECPVCQGRLEQPGCAGCGSQLS